jgi:hypothetical protein
MLQHFTHQQYSQSGPSCMPCSKVSRALCFCIELAADGKHHAIAAASGSSGCLPVAVTLLISEFQSLQQLAAAADAGCI